MTNDSAAPACPRSPANSPTWASRPCSAGDRLPACKDDPRQCLAAQQASPKGDPTVLACNAGKRDPYAAMAAMLQEKRETEPNTEHADLDRRAFAAKAMACEQGMGCEALVAAVVGGKLDGRGSERAAATLEALCKGNAEPATCAWVKKACGDLGDAEGRKANCAKGIAHACAVQADEDKLAGRDPAPSWKAAHAQAAEALDRGCKANQGGVQGRRSGSVPRGGHAARPGGRGPGRQRSLRRALPPGAQRRQRRWSPPPAHGQAAARWRRRQPCGSLQGWRPRRLPLSRLRPLAHTRRSPALPCTRRPLRPKDVSMAVSTLLNSPRRALPMRALLTLALAGLPAACGGESGSGTSADSTAADASTDAVATDASGSTDGHAADAALGDASSCSARAGTKAPATLDAKRPAKVYAPKAWDGCTAYPLVVLLHGYSANGELQNAYLGLSARVDSHGFVLLVPEGTKAPNGKQFWNATEACCDFYHQGVDDVGYIRGLIEAAKSELAIDPERVYLFGHSNGGFMSYRMACEASELVTGIVSLAGAVTATAADCKPVRPVNVLQIHGTNDKTIGYLGGPLFPSAAKGVERWRGLDGCTGDPTAMAAVDFDIGASGAETTGQIWSGCAEGTQVGLWTMQGSAHIPGFNDAFRDAVVTHLLAFRRQN